MNGKALLEGRGGPDKPAGAALITVMGNERFAGEEHAMTDSVDLGPKLEEVVSQLVKSGRFNSKTDVLREGVRLVHEREARLTALDAAITRGLADADAGRLAPMDEVFTRLQAKYERAARAKDE
jgi:antitoxin ParD1/3/4